MRTLPVRVLLITTSLKHESALTNAKLISDEDALLMNNLPLNLLFPLVFQIPVPVTVLLIMATPLKILFPNPVLVVAPVLVMVSESANVAPLKVTCGAIKVTLPPNTVLGPIVIAAVAPVNVKLVDSVPDCVKRGNNKLPPVNPETPTDMVLPAAIVAADVALEQNERLPVEVLLKIKLPPNATLVFAAEQNVILPVEVLVSVTSPEIEVLEFANSPNNTLPVALLLTVTSPPKIFAPA